MKLQSGAKPTRPDRRDYDHAKSFGLVAPPSFPKEFNVDAALWQPDQNAMGLPFGCTGMTGADLCTNEDGQLYDPADLYHNTPPYDEGGRDIRAALKTLITRGPRNGTNEGPKRTAYFAIRSLPPMDFYDSIRMSMLSTAQEKRGVSVGIPWFPEFEKPLDDATLFAPNDYVTSRATWHNIAVCGWDQRGLKIKSWQGEKYGEGGFVYMNRALINTLMAIPGTAAFTVSKVAPGQIQTIDMGFVEWLVSYIRLKLGL